MRGFVSHRSVPCSRNSILDRIVGVSGPGYVGVFYAFGFSGATLVTNHLIPVRFVSPVQELRDNMSAGSKRKICVLADGLRGSFSVRRPILRHTGGAKFG